MIFLEADAETIETALAAMAGVNSAGVRVDFIVSDDVWAHSGDQIKQASLARGLDLERVNLDVTPFVREHVEDRKIDDADDPGLCVWVAF